MASAAVHTATDRRIQPFATAAIVSVAALDTMLHCVATTLGSGYWFDEVYMLAIGRYHLEWGSADQPPVTPALAALMDAVLPGSHLALTQATALSAEFYIVAAYVDGYSDRYRLPGAYSLSRSYGYFAPPSAELDAGRAPGPLRAYFGTSREAGDVGDDMHAYLLTGQRQSWAFI